MIDATQGIAVRRVRWRDAEADLAAVRRRVFVEEQGVPAVLEWDGRDSDCMHAIALAVGAGVVGTGRLLPDGHIGRMAVLPEWRGRGIGSMIVQDLISAAREAGHRRARLNAQTHALGFYARFGFVAEGPEFDDAGIPHRAMTLVLR